MTTYSHVSASRSPLFEPKRRWRRLWLAAIVMLAVTAATQPAPVAAGCGQCDAGCFLENDAYALLEAFGQDKSAFAERAGRCAASDPIWTEILDNLNEADQPPPQKEGSRRRQVSKFELAKINLHLGIKSCMQFCGLEQFEEECFAGPGGKSCNCKPGAEAYCRSQASKSSHEWIAPSYKSGDEPSPPPSVTGATQRDEEGFGEPEPDPAAEGGYMIEVAVSADGFEPSTVFAPCDFEPSSVSVSGVVTDDDGQPVSGARVSLVGLGAVTATGSTGAYTLAAQTEGDEPFSARRDVMIVRLLRDLRATVTPVSIVWANGREYEAVLTVTAGGLPLAGKEITVTDWKGFSRQGHTIDYVTARRGNNIPLRLDDGGQIRFQFEAPIVPRDKGATIADPDNLFPVDGHFRVMVRGQDAETTCDYRVESPFPKIGQIRVPGNVDAGLWQVSPSFIVIDDPDSNRFRVTVRGLGDLRTTQPGAATKKGALTHEFTGNRFEFLYRPPKEGLDPTALPDVLDQFMNTSKNIYISVATNVAGGMLLDKVQIHFAKDAFGKGLSKMGLELDAGKLLDAGGNMANVVNLGSGTYLDSTMVSEDPNDVQKKIVAGGNLIIGVVDTGMGFAGTLGTPQQKLAWEAAKAYWEYLKLMNSVSDQYHELAEAYQGTVLHPILVTVEDESGHRTTATRACSVRVWKGGSQ